MTKSSTKLKVCGITQTNQALEIASLGASAIGVIGVKHSPRFISNRQRSLLFKELANYYPSTSRVLVVADISDSELEKEFMSEGVPNIIQLHGNESKERCQSIRRQHPSIKLWKAFRVKSKKDLNSINQYEDCVDCILLDAWSETQLGGTGKRLQLELLINKEFKIPWWLAGGVCAEWIPDLLMKLKPYGIDASSKLETKPGIKDIKKVEQLIRSIKAFEV